MRGGNLLKQDPGTLELNVCLKEKEKKLQDCKRDAKPCAWTVKTDVFLKQKQTKKRTGERKRQQNKKWDQKKWEVLGSLLESYRIKL